MKVKIVTGTDRETVEHEVNSAIKSIVEQMPYYNWDIQVTPLMVMGGANHNIPRYLYTIYGR